MNSADNSTKSWNTPMLAKLGTLKDVAGGSFSGNDSNGSGVGAAKNPVS